MSNSHKNYNQNELYHYGILGMRWGVRRFQPYPKDYTGNGKEIGEARRKTKFNYDDDILIKKNTKAYRIALKKNENDNKFNYVTFDKNDRNFYKAMWPETLRSIVGVADNNTKIYEQTYKTKKDIILPSAKKREEVYSKLYARDDIQDAIVRQRGVRWLTKNLTRTNPKTGKKEAITYEEAKKIEEIFFDQKEPQYMKFISTKKDELHTLYGKDQLSKAALIASALGQSDYIKSAVKKEFLDQNYKAFVDDHGADFAGNGQRVNMPVVIMETDELLKQINSKEVTKRAEDIALETYKSDISTIPGKMSEKYYTPNVIKKHFGTDNYNYNKTFEYIYGREGRKK